MQLYQNSLSLLPTHDTIAPVSYWISLSAAAFNHNVTQLRRIIAPTKKLAFVIKANAYGHGMQQMAQLAQDNSQIDWLCTFSLSEALALRSYNVTKPILVLGYIDVDPYLAVGKNIACAIDSLQTAHLLHTAAQKAHGTIPVHVKIDTGLSRFGVLPEQAVSFITQLARYDTISIEGIFTHFAESQKEDDAFTQAQLALFFKVLQELAAKNISIPLTHVCNSAALMSLPLEPYNLYRIGLALYGYYPSKAAQEHIQMLFPEFNLKPVLQLHSKIIRIKKIPAYSYVSYNRTVQVTRDTVIGIVPFGYSDGLDILFSNKSFVTIHGCKAPLLGRIAMNVMLVDITDIPNVAVNDLVTIFGDKADNNVQHICNMAGIDNVRTLLARLPEKITRYVDTLVQ